VHIKALEAAKFFEWLLGAELATERAKMQRRGIGAMDANIPPTPRKNEQDQLQVLKGSF
jgi:hypothetical protein